MFDNGVFNPSAMRLLQTCFEHVWQILEPELEGRAREATRFAIADALFALAKAGQRDRERLTVYALSKAQETMRAP